MMRFAKQANGAVLAPNWALNFVDGSGDRVEVGNVQTDPTVFTYCGWYKFSAMTSNRRLIEKAGAAVGTIYINTSGTAGTITTFVDYATTDAQANTTAAFYQTGVWYFIALTFDGASAPKIFRGDLSGSLAEATYGLQTAPVGARVTDSGGTLKIGNGNLGNNNRGFPGSIGPVAWINRVLPPSELAELMRSSPILAPKVLGSWTLGSNLNGRQFDLSENGFNGIVTAATPGNGPPSFIVRAA